MAYFTSLKNANREIDRLRDQLQDTLERWDAEAERANGLYDVLKNIESVSTDRHVVAIAAEALDTDERRASLVGAEE
jgi:hypothetical protein